MAILDAGNATGQIGTPKPRPGVFDEATVRTLFVECMTGATDTRWIPAFAEFEACPKRPSPALSWFEGRRRLPDTGYRGPRGTGYSCDIPADWGYNEVATYCERFARFGYGVGTSIVPTDIASDELLRQTIDGTLRATLSEWMRNLINRIVTVLEERRSTY